ncbi:MAG: UDP-glucose dehydrogenase family protein [Planctomycetota bacterium]|jgi:UDPglucose 6-dehydrogenase
MRISIVGTGYVGLVTGACFAESGNRVTCVDIDQKKIDMLNRGEVPIFEPGLEEMVKSNAGAHRLAFSTDLREAVLGSRVIFLAVGTPPAEDGSADLGAILEVARQIGRCIDGYRIIVMKSTVPVGTHKKVSDAIAAETDQPFDYVSNPEFLKEGAAIEDFMKPDRIIIGANSAGAINIMKDLYGAFMRRDERIFIMDPASAEMSKYAANAMLATRISFMNEVAGLCEHYGADVEKVRRGVGSDSRIGSAFLYPGVGFGGSCFPKDVSAMASMGRAVDFPTTMVDAVREVNQRQRERFAARVINHFGDRCADSTLAVWGLAFKARTDDVREAPAIFAINQFLEAGMKVRAHDPEAMITGRAELPDNVIMCEDGYEALDGADALVIFTDWNKFRTPDFDEIAGRLSAKLIFDGRNMYDPEAMARRGFRYHCIGRVSVDPA